MQDQDPPEPSSSSTPARTTEKDGTPSAKSAARHPRIVAIDLLKDGGS